MSGGFSLDLRNDDTRFVAALIQAEFGLALKINTGMNGTRGMTALQVARYNGFTHKGTNHGALLDVIGLRQAVQTDYEPSETAKRALNAHFGDERGPKELAKAIRKANKIAAENDRLAEAGEPPQVWRGV